MTSDSPTTTTLTLAVLRRFHFGELSGQEKAAVEEALERDPEAKARLERMRAEEAAFLERTDLALESAKIVERMRAPATEGLAARLRRLFGGSGLRLAAALVVLVALIPFGRALWSPAPGPNRTKGSVQLEMFVKDGAGVRRGEDGMRLREGDQVQFRYRAVGRRYVFVVSADSRGVLSPLYPDLPTRSIPVRPDGRHTLEGSIILDDAVGPERIFAVFSDEPLTFDTIREALEDEADLTALREIDLRRQDVDQATILIMKE